MGSPHEAGWEMKILITGGAGYIGATIASACLDAGIEPVILDDLSTGRAEHLEGRIAYRGDIADADLVDRIVGDHPDLYAVIHCAARIVVPESVTDPIGYYRSNVAGTLDLLHHLRRNGITRIVFSSSASVYAAEDGSGVSESDRLLPLSPYARSKAMVEAMLQDAADAGVLRALSLRYFNPIGVDPLLRTGPTSERPSHVLGLLISAWAAGQPFTITGTDWPTRDGSGLRDFVHVWDLARAHVRAVQRFDDIATPTRPHAVLNVGTGTGTTVRELVEMFRGVVGDGLDIREGPRRPGDSAGAYALVGPAQQALDWRAQLSVTQGIRDALAWRDSRQA